MLITYIIKINKGKPCKKDLPLLKTISQQFQGSDIYIFIDTMQGFVDSFGTIRKKPKPKEATMKTPGSCIETYKF